MTFTREAAKTLLTRAPLLTAGTIYSLSWPLVRQFGVGTRRGAASAPAYTQRPVRNEFDSILDDYAEAAPSRRQRGSADEQAERLHEWDGVGPPPLDLAALNASAAPVRYLLPIAKWLAAGRPGLTSAARYDTVIVDEAQDMSTLEMAMAGALVAPGGSLLCYGDPGQAIFAAGKGLKSGTLPAAWQIPGERRLLSGGYRCGEPVASVAARVLRPIWDRPAAAFAAPHETTLTEWWPSSEDTFGPGDLVLGYSRSTCSRFICDWGLRRVALVPSVDSGRKVTVCTGHAAKGHEADRVFLLPWSDRPRNYSALDRLDAGEPAELRLLYTMITRARRELFVPSTLLARMT